MKPIRRSIALLIAGASAVPATMLFLPRSVEAHNCVVVGTPLTTIQSATDCADLAGDPSTTTHECTGTTGTVAFFLCLHNETSVVR